MPVTIKRKSNYLYAFLKGEIDHHTAPEIRESIDDALSSSEQCNFLVIDFSDVTFMDSSGVGMLIGRYKTMRERGGCVFAAGMTSQTEKLFRMAGLHRIIKIVEDKERVASDE